MSKEPNRLYRVSTRSYLAAPVNCWNHAAEKGEGLPAYIYLTYKDNDILVLKFARYDKSILLPTSLFI